MPYLRARSFSVVVRRPIRGVSVALLLGLSSLVRPSAAQTTADPIAHALKDTGDRAIVEGRFAEALDAYTRALAVEPSAALHYNRGRALQGLGRNAEALVELETFQAEATPALLTAVNGLSEMIATVRAQVAELSVVPATPGATLQINGRSIALPLRQPLRFDPALIDVSIDAPGYLPLRLKLVLVAGEQRKLAPTLQRRDVTALLRVRSAIPGALVLVDGKRLGVAPVEARLEPGAHRLELHHPDYVATTTQVVLGARERRDVDLSASRLPRLYEKWWFWSAVGAVATGAVVAVVAASTEKSPATGDIPPGRLSISLERR